MANARCWKCGNCRKVLTQGASPMRNPCTNKPGVKGIVSAKREVKGAEFDPLTFTPAIVTVRRVPIVMAGVEYRLSTGPATFTPEDIMDFVASQDDPAIVAPRLKIGHESILSNTESADGTLKNFDDGVPALGKFINIDFDEDNITAVGDLVTVRWLAEIMPLAYPNRSIEGFQEALTNTGHVWGLVVHAVALLGVVWPGVSTLDDLPLLYGADAPDGIEVVNDAGEEVDVNKFVAAARGRQAAPGTPVSAAVNVEDVRRQYYDSLNADQMWWWIRAIYIDPNELIVQDDDSGELFRVPFNVSGDTVEFSDPEQVQIQYVNVNAAGGGQEQRAVALLASSGRQLAVYASRAESRPESNEQEDTLRLSAAAINLLRARLGLTAEQLPDGATEAQISAAGITPALLGTLGINAAEGETTDNPPDVPPNQGGAPSDPAATPGEEEGDIEEPGTGGEPPAGGDGGTNASIPEGMMLVPQTEWARVQQGTQAALARAESDENDRRDRALTAGLEGGRIRPADVPSYRNMHAAGGASRDVFYRLLTETVENGGLAAGLVPVTERGALPAGDGTNQGDVSAAEYDASWLSPQERSRIDAIKAGTYEPPQVSMDDNYHRNGAGAGAR